MSDSTEYIQVLAPNKKQLRKLLEIAKGDYRTMSDFAKDCGVSATTFSRIKWGGMAKPLTVELLERIAENASDSKAVTFKMLMRANGFLPEDDELINIIKKENFYKSDTTPIRKIITEELKSRGYDAELLDEELMTGLRNQSESNRHGLSVAYHFALKIAGIEPLLWKFIIDPTGYLTKSSQTNGTDEYREFSMSRHAPLLLTDAWDIEASEQTKTTIVFVNADGYEKFKHNLKDIQLNGRISIMLVDIHKRTLVKEEMLTRKNGRVERSLFERKRRNLRNYYDA